MLSEDNHALKNVVRSDKLSKKRSLGSAWQVGFLQCLHFRIGKLAFKTSPSMLMPIPLLPSYRKDFWIFSVRRLHGFRQVVHHVLVHVANWN